MGCVRVTVAVPTYHRTRELKALLPLLVDHARTVTAHGGERWGVDLLVVDNDPAASAERVVTRAAERAGGIGLRYVVEATPGIAAVRNRALDEATESRLLVFLDDDERPEPRWLEALLGTWTATGAAAVSGRVLAEYQGKLDPWIAAGRFFVRRNLPTGSPIDVAATNNLLLDLPQVRAAGTRFETALGLGGGEDTLFSRRLSRAGARMVWCAESAVVDQVPAARMTRRWVLVRAWTSGNSAVRADLYLSPLGLPRLRVQGRGLVAGCLRTAVGCLRFALGVVRRSPRHQARGLRTAMRGLGMLGAVVGVVHEEYARDGRHWRLCPVPHR
jgi:hypothetical protein